MAKSTGRVVARRLLERRMPLVEGGLSPGDLAGLHHQAQGRLGNGPRPSQRARSTSVAFGFVALREVVLKMGSDKK